ncbi:NACHT domain-containing protein [Amycolatopsis samaneae]|uniref:NACHT domain-containing protein n=1 Tax=Amycolatopsis samaneae TaxID=664691 RepID=A0ABW5G9V2_9PSEU
MLKVGQAVAKQVALKWLADKKAESRRGRDLTRLVRARFPLRRDERDILDALVKIEDDVAKQLTPGLAETAYGLPDNEREAAFDAVSDALEEADLSDHALFAVDLDPGALAAAVRGQRPVERAALSEQGTRLYEVALDRACVVLTHLVKELPEFNAAVAVETLGRLRRLLDDVDRLFERLPDRELAAPSGRDFDEQFRRRYLGLVARSYNHLDVIGLTTHTYEPRTTLSVAYLSLTVTTDSERPQRRTRDRAIADWLHQDMRRSRGAENVRVELALGGSKLTVIRGEAGAGKSTLLRWLAVNAARTAFTDQLEEWNECVPFLVKLRDFPQGPLPRGDELLTQPSSPQCGPVPEGWVHRQCESGRALLLVDGVDELAARRRNAVKLWLREMLNSYPDLRVVVTSRPTAVTSKWLVRDGFRSVVLEPMTSDDVKVFLRRWHAALLDSTPEPDLLPCHPDEVPEHERALLAQLQARAHLRALARSPLLCAMLCALNLDRRAKLPRDRLALYSAALDMLLERRDADRNVTAGEEIQVSANEKLVLLRVLAWWLNENGRTEMSRDQAIARLADRLRGMPNVREDAETLLSHLIERSGVIRQPVQGRVDFIHRTFQEFLAAREAIDRDSIDLLIGHARSDLWRETVLMACAQGSEEQRGRLLTGILDKADRSPAKTARQLNLLAAACKETAILAPPEALDRVDARIAGLVPPRSVRESRSLATVGESFLDHLPETLTELSEAQAAACVRTASLVNGPQALDVLTRYAHDPRVKVQRELVQAWKYFDPEAYARRVLADAPLTLEQYKLVEVDFPAAVPFLHLLRNLRRCRINLWGCGPVAEEVGTLGGARGLVDLVLLGDRVPPTLRVLGELRELDFLFLDFAAGCLDSVDFLASLVGLRTLFLANSASVAEFSFLDSLTSLEAVHFVRNSVMDWMDKIAYPEKITSLTCAKISDGDALVRVTERFRNAKNIRFYRCQTLDNLRSMRNLSLTSMHFSDCDFVDFGGISNLSTLRNIVIDGRSRKVDVTPLADMPLRITVGRGVELVGVDKLGPGVVLRRV